MLQGEQRKQRTKWRHIFFELLWSISLWSKWHIKYTSNDKEWGFCPIYSSKIALKLSLRDKSSTQNPLTWCVLVA